MSVYFIQAVNGGPIKIGFSKDVAGCHERLRTLQTGHHEPLKITRIIEDGTRHTEAALHRRFDEFRCRGEWFTNAPEVAIEADALPNETDRAWRRGYLVGVDEGRDWARNQIEDAKRDAMQARATAMQQGRLLRDAFALIPWDHPRYAALWERAAKLLNMSQWLAKAQPGYRRSLLLSEDERLAEQVAKLDAFHAEIEKEIAA